MHFSMSRNLYSLMLITLPPIDYVGRCFTLIGCTDYLSLSKMVLTPNLHPIVA